MAHPRAEAEALVESCRRQGFRVKATKKGWIVFAKATDRGAVTIHGTPSDWRTVKNTVTSLRKIGVEA